MNIVYNNVLITFEVLTNNLYKITGPNFIVETHKIGILDENEKDKLFNVVLSFDDKINEDFEKNAIYVSRGICMHDKSPLVISFGGLIGKFDLPLTTNVDIDKDVNSVAYFYLIVGDNTM